ncbi:Gfo/Idh/MocA family protein [Thermophilibacter immobilis]|jgi:predicted dehydrogenase|uniref:Gfo/Idh/MocA family oxidoreductase n=1 Tax=Thermophilibacter immobilis TaxID=2779519 RepID=A0A7S7M7P5_9ACTN|nr:Gfo/Idh/MocA family oxidoreductase [Thermophilibacter immobilis]QOY59947.1 Gfo/Idh/MocA family oxidoreductase [Thermophilibacter immobilis]
MDKKVRFATIGTSGICEQFLQALPLSEEGTYVGAYSRDRAHARAFGEPHGARLFFDDLSTLATSPEVDAVYVASPNALHAPQALELIARGKHVLVEKSLASNEREAQDVFDAARTAGVVAMEAIRNLYVPTFDAIERTLGELGRVRQATLRFAKVTSRMARLAAGERLNIFDPRMSAGALMDIGVYCVEPAVALFGVPQTVRALGVTAAVPGEPEGSAYATIDLAGEVLLGYGDKIVSISYGKAADDMLSSQVAGEKATLVWDQTSCPVNLRVHEHEDKGMVFRVGAEELRPLEVEVPERDMVCEIDAFVGAVRGDAAALARRERFEGVTLGSLHVMDEVRRQVGVRFPADERAEA